MFPQYSSAVRSVVADTAVDVTTLFLIVEIEIAIAQ